MRNVTDGKKVGELQTDSIPPVRVTVLCLSALGDILLALPLIAEVRRIYPNTFLTAVCARSSVAALLRELGVADDIVTLSSKARRYPWALLSSLREVRKITTDIAFQTFSSHGSFGNLVLGATRAPIRCGFRAGYFQNLLTHLVPIDASQHRIILNLSLLRRLGHGDIQPPLGRFLPPIERQTGADTLEAPYILCSAGSDPKLAFKRWPNEKWRHLCQELVSDGYRVVFVGDASQDETVRQILSGIEEAGVNLAGKTTFSELASLIHSSLAVVATDGMILHLGAALGKECVGIFGPTHPEIGGPWGRNHEKAWLALPCSPCYGSLSVGKGSGCQTRECLSHLPVSLVHKKLRDVLAQPGTGRDSTLGGVKEVHAEAGETEREKSAPKKR